MIASKPKDEKLMVGAELVAERDVEIATPSGLCDAHFAYPTSGAHSPILVWPDFVSLRPCFRNMGRRLAARGYAVLTVNPYYRSARSPILADGVCVADTGIREQLIGLVRTLAPAMVSSDAAAFVDWLDIQPETDVDKKVGTVGYCMGGGFAVRTAHARTDRVGAVGSFHGSRLVMSDADSPHRLMPDTNAVYLFAIAQNDDESESETTRTLRTACQTMRATAEVEVYPANHGWCISDSLAYNEVEAHRAWQNQDAMLHRALA